MHLKKSLNTLGIFALVGIGFFGSLIFPSFGETEFKLIALSACLLFTAVNLISVESAGQFQVVMFFLSPE